jgi:hypothetical protein
MVLESITVIYISSQLAMVFQLLCVSLRIIEL